MPSDSLRLFFVAVASLLILHPSSASPEKAGPTPGTNDWRPMVKPEALSTAEFAKRLDSATRTNATDLDSADTKRSFLLLYPPSSPGVQKEPRSAPVVEKPSPRQAAESVTNLQSRHHAARDFGGQSHQRTDHQGPGYQRTDDQGPGHQRPRFPPVANPPPLPEHAMRNRRRPPPSYKPEPTSNHQVQIQLLDGYIVPPQAGGLPPSNKKAPRIATFPLNLNNVPEIRLLLPGDVHQQLNNLRQPQQHPSQNRPAPAYQQNAHSFDSQRRPGRPEYGSGERSISGGNYGNGGAPQSNAGNQHQQVEQRKVDPYSPPDRSVYPETVNFPGQDGQGYRNIPGGQATGGSGHANPVQNGNVLPQEEKIDSRPAVGLQSGQNADAQSFARNGHSYNSQSSAGVDSSGQRFEQTKDAGQESFRPVYSDNRNMDTRRDYNTLNGPTATQFDDGRSSHQNSNLDPRSNPQFQNQSGTRNAYSNGWQAAQPNRGRQNYNRVVMSQGMANFYNVNSNGQNANSRANAQADFHANNQNANSQSVPNANINSFSNATDSSLVSSTAVGVQSNFAQSNGNGALMNDDAQFNRGRRISTGDFSTQSGLGDGVSSTAGGSTEGVFFMVPEEITQDMVQTQIEPLDSRTSGDSSVGTSGGAKPGRVDPFEQSGFETVSSFGSGSTDGPLSRNVQCDCPSRTCAPLQRSPGENLGSSIREVARALNAEAFFDFVGLTDEEIENTLSSDGSYTLFIPSNEAVNRLPSNLIDHWRNNNPDLTTALLNHVVRDKIPLSQLRLGGRMTSKANDATVFINNYNNEAVTVNGHRIVHGDVTGPKGGTIHVIDGTLCPVASQDIINTLRTCNKYDGFLTLADVTKLLNTMQDDGPFTVFLPSNEALTKIPSEELAVLKENSTVLRGFLEYHIVRGAYFSGDLKDGQYLSTLHNRDPIRVGVRVDGCHRRLVDVNNSPVFKADIPTKNGVIHVVDWILRPGDLQWCDGLILP